MSFVLADRVKETTTTGGTADIQLAGPVTKYRAFTAGVGNGNQTYYAIECGDGTSWEVGIGTVTAGSPDTLSRDTVLASSAAGAKIALSGTSKVWCDSPATLLQTIASIAPNNLVGKRNNGVTGALETITPGTTLQINSAGVIDVIGGAGTVGTVQRIDADSVYLVSSPAPITTSGTIMPSNYMKAAIDSFAIANWGI